MELDNDYASRGYRDGGENAICNGDESRQGGEGERGPMDLLSGNRSGSEDVRGV